MTLEPITKPTTPLSRLLSLGAGAVVSNQFTLLLGDIQSVFRDSVSDGFTEEGEGVEVGWGGGGKQEVVVHDGAAVLGLLLSTAHPATPHRHPIIAASSSSPPLFSFRPT